MNVIVESERDQRTLDWLLSQVGIAEIEEACLKLEGNRKPYVSNIVKVLELSPPESVLMPTRAEARLRLVAVKELLKKKER